MPRPIKVFGGCFDGRNRLIVATTSLKKASELFCISYNQVREYAHQTWNDVEVKTAMSKVGTVFYSDARLSKDQYKERTNINPCR